MTKAINYILDIFYPNRCPFCDGFIKWDYLICEKCFAELEYIHACDKCGKVECMCDKSLFYDDAHVLFAYGGIVKESILALKEKNGINAARFYGEKLSERIIASGKIYDMIVPVPMSKSKKKIRGYNQSSEIAEFIARKLNIPVVDALIKKENTIVQHTLSKNEREENVKGMFLPSDIYLSENKIILCDDVITTGSTMNECARILKSMGADYITAVAPATTNLNNTNA